MYSKLKHLKLLTLILALATGLGCANQGSSVNSSTNTGSDVPEGTYMGALPGNSIIASDLDFIDIRESPNGAYLIYSYDGDLLFCEALAENDNYLILESNSSCPTGFEAFNPREGFVREPDDATVTSYY